MSHNRNEDEIKRDFAKAIQSANQALDAAIHAIFQISQNLAQMIVSIRKHQKELESGAQAALHSGRTESLPSLAPSLASGLDQQLKSLSQQNQELKISLEQLRSLEGKLPQDNTRDLNSRLEALDRSIQTTSEQNRQLEKENIKSVFLGQPLAAASRERALEVKGELDKTLGDLSKQVQQLRTPAPTEPTASPAQVLPTPFSNKPQRR